MGVAMVPLSGAVRGKKSGKVFSLVLAMAIEVNASVALWFIIYDNKTGEFQKVQKDDLEVIV